MKKIFNVIVFFVSSMTIAAQDVVKIRGLNGGKGSYNKSARTAYVKLSEGETSFYRDVVEYSKAVTPPSSENPLLKPFATMPNPKYKDSNPKMGGEKQIITLYGIPQDSTQEAFSSGVTLALSSVKDPSSNFIIYGSTGNYDSVAKVAYLVDAQGKKEKYVDIVEYSQPVTPPNVENKKLKAFATMPNPKYKKKNKKLSGGQFENVILFGIKQK